MRSRFRTVLMSLVVALVAAAGLGIHAHSQAVAYTPVIVLFDNDSPGQPPGNPGRGFWGFGPQHIAVAQGDKIDFVMAQSNHSAHTVASLTWGGTPVNRTLESGSLFNSSPSAEQYLQAGSTWTLDTTPIPPGQYVFYCAIHPWEIGTITVSPA